MNMTPISHTGRDSPQSILTRGSQCKQAMAIHNASRAAVHRYGVPSYGSGLPRGSTTPISLAPINRRYSHGL